MARLPQESYVRIQQCTEYILENMVNIENVTDYLFSEDVLSIDQISEIEAKVKGRQRVKKFLSIIMNECSDCYDQFLEALREKGFAQIADRIDSGIDDSRPINGSIQIKTEPISSHSMPNRDRKPDIKTNPGHVERGQMRSDHFEIWTRLHEHTVQHFSTQLREVTKKMAAEQIISEDDMEIINRETKENYNVGGATKLVEILGERGDLVLPRIKNALRNINNKVAYWIEDELNELGRN
ncbi:hypothetical protein SNE40_002159 [Patella caerulea]|uniref:CARD domain-containing protein n=1 Tax=Patella caerulea TaxID=87958 RepID=A0AAN8KBQ4_PATCE